MAKTKQTFERVNLGDDFTQAGLPDAFVGEVTDAYYTISNFHGKAIDRATGNVIFKLVARLEFTPDEDSGFEPFAQDYSASGLQFFVPLNEDGELAGPDGIEISDFLALGKGEAEEPDEEILAQIRGVYVGKVGNLDTLPKGSNFEVLVEKLKEVGYDGLGENLRESMVGLYGRWDRINPPTRSGLVAEQGRSGPGKILVLTEPMERAKSGAKKGATKAGATKATTATKAKATAAEAEEGAAGEAGEPDEFDVTLSAVVLEALMDSGGSLTKSKLPQIVMKALEGSDKAKGVKRVTEASFLSNSELWSYDGDSGTLTVPE